MYVNKLAVNILILRNVVITKPRTQPEKLGRKFLCELHMCGKDTINQGNSVHEEPPIQVNI